MRGLMDIYRRLLGHFGPQNWWPGDTPFEVVVGAILTQQTAWRNVEKAIANLKKAGLMNLHSLASSAPEEIAPMVAVCGFHKTKPLKLTRLASYIRDKYGRLDSFLGRPGEVVREELLEMDGIGPETADSILCYASDKLYFVVDAYTRRVGKRLGLLDSDRYQVIQAYFHDELPKDIDVYREFHALIVELGKRYCRTRPICRECPLGDMCKSSRRSDNG